MTHHEQNDADNSSSLEARGKRVKIVRDLLDMTQREFAQFCGIGFSTVCQWEHGRLSGLAPKSAHTILRALESKSTLVCSLNWLLDGMKGGPPPYFREEGYESVLESSAEPLVSTEEALKLEVEAFGHLDPKALVVAVRDDAMLPFLKPGDYVGGQRLPLDEFDLNAYVGELLIVQTLEGQILVRRLSGRTATGKYRLSAMNPQTTAELVIEAQLVALAVITRLWRIVPNEKL